ncbi:dipeptide ABC transporter ATP-binding protein [Pelagimonas varians]|uniref:Glutathione import ATP-binding protein GsiA n=1 Tax=Pelagimonas varians TaxID=696760 RepID=A0A238L4V7_9RHOB|nr:ABC transporter ATP-binding protein [Pelagimonas varians]PYG25613.1 peptide/nickel transport system ATP-binding protein [Pelagimonas varians]SMX49861.1 Glutathione import ATP-binding protein GsiA [Pelagimonas varians]
MLTIKDLAVKFPSRFGDVSAIEDVDMTIAPGEIHGLVGESGAGKSTVGAAVIGLLSTPGYIAGGELTLGDTDLRSLSEQEAHAIRGDRISMIFQDPQTSLNPLMTIEDQLVETIQAHSDVSQGAAVKRAVDLLEEIGIDNAATRIKAYPHQFSGGMRQRVVIALAICTDPELIIADEPTTALDVAVQSQVLDLIRRLAKDRQIAFMLITHDIGVIAQIADRVTVMRKGRVMETGDTEQVLSRPTHPYTRALMDAVPPLDHRITRFRTPTDAETAPPGSIPDNAAERWLLEGQQHELLGLTLDGIHLSFPGTRTSIWRKPDPFVALQDINLTIRPGSIMGLVGESGSGKSTLAKAITGLIAPTSGTMFLGDNVLPAGRARKRNDPSRQLIQMVFQDPYSSLNSRHRIGDILSEPLWLYGFVNDAAERRSLAAAMLELVGMAPDAIDKYPHQFSGGQRQRVAVARALLARPRFLICDEPTSALDVSIQAEILNLLKDLQSVFGLTILFISHNLAVVRQMSDDIAVLRNGKIEEIGSTEGMFERPQADYTKKLLALTPVMPRTWQV